MRATDLSKPFFTSAFHAGDIAGGILAWEFLLMHFVEVRRWQDIRKFGSVNEVNEVSGHMNLLGAA